jgi:hypothetical protein
VLYKLSDDISLFARSSRGGRFNSDRQTVGGKIRADGALCTSADATNHVGGCSADGVTPSVDFVNQYETRREGARSPGRGPLHG